MSDPMLEGLPAGPPDLTRAEFHGPYDADANGTDAEGAPLNAHGRTQAMNVEIGGD